MSVGLVIGRLGPGAAERQLFELGRSLDPKRHAVRVYCLSGLTEPYGRRLEAAGIPVTIIRRRRAWDPARLLALASALRRDAIDVVHAFPTGSLYGALAARVARIPTIIPSVRDGGRSPTGSAGRMLACVYRGASAVLADSQASAAEVVRSFGVCSERVRIVYDGVDLARFPRPSRLDGLRDRVRSGPLLIGGIGPLSQSAAPAPCLLAAARLATRHPDVRFVWLRDGEQRGAAEHLARECGVPLALASVEDRVVTELPRLSMLWLTTDWHDVADVVLEAMAAARPVLAVRVRGIEELVADGVTGFIVEPDDPGALSGRADQLLRDSARRRQLGQAARARAAGQFALPEMVRAIAALYEEALLGI